MRWKFILSLCACAFFLSAQNRSAQVRQIDFNRDIRPILSDKCWACHGPDASAKKLKRFDSEDTIAGVIVPGNPEQSKLIKRITHADEDLRMPPKDSGRTLTEREKELLTEWIRQGAKWQQHWSFIPPVKPALPTVKHQAWVRNPIDAFVLARLEKEGLQPAPASDRVTLLRRVSLDLTGLPPTPAEVDAFVRDSSPNAYERVVDRLLASPRYGERMAFRWLDVARYADTSGYQSDRERQMWRWRDWVIESFNRNQPYDQFIVEQLAGDLLPNATMEQRLATGFNRNHRGNSEAGIIAEEYATEYVIDRVDTTATAFLGLTAGCARCHNHKYDPLSQREYYQLFAYFNSIPENGLHLRAGNTPPTMIAPTTEQQRELQRIDARLAQLEARLRTMEPQIEAAQQAWEKSLTDAQQWFSDDGLIARFALDGADKMLGAARYEAGRIGLAAAFDGKTTLLARQTGSFSHSSPLTLSVWIYPTSENAGAILTCAENAATGELATDDPNQGKAWIGPGYGLFLDGGKLHFTLVRNWQFDAIRVETKDKLALNQWHHIAATYDGRVTRDGVAVYVDGVAQSLKSNGTSIAEPFTITQPWRIGGVDALNPRHFHGLIDEVRIYDLPLAPAQIAVLANAKTLREIAASTNRTKADNNKLRGAFLAQSTGATQRLWQRIAALQLQKARVETAAPSVMVMQETPEPRPAFVLKRGSYDAPGEAISRGLPATLPPLPANAPNNRLGLAQWLVHPSHPLTARVAVNRFWQMLFGVGLVKTAEDFGAQGEWPSHPELLDWLACELQNAEFGSRNDGSNSSPQWNVKALLKTIVMSATYRQSSQAMAELIAKDPENRWLARGPRLRLPAEMIRDQALFVSGLLVEQIGGPSVKPYQPAGLWDNMSSSGLVYQQDHGDKLYRRSLYTYWKRTIAPPLMANFDAAGRDTCVVREHRTNTPLQALNLMNDVAFVEAARMLAERAMREGGKTDAERLAYAFRLATARHPNAQEQQILLSNLQAQRVAMRNDSAQARNLLSVGEKKADAKLNPIELAAYTTVMSLILNLDEVVTKE
jgi:Protein of unknown function (DUF1553)/Protein of unknown function (DUF1549)/Concanavalin A-like lectin/glucanases superfamily/Planctomycete cytochrome C